MEIKEFGKEKPQKIVLIPGCMMCWKQFDALIPYLAKRYHVIAVSTDGFDGTVQTTFTTAENSANKLAEYIKEKLDGNVQLVFGESFGSATAVMLFNDKSIRADSLIINGPQYMNLGPFTKLLAHIIPRNQYRMLGKMKNAGKNGKLPLLLKLFTRSGDGNMLDMFAKMPDNISFETLDNCTKEGLSLYGRIEQFDRDPKARVSVWYGAKEPNMKKAVQKIKTVYPNAQIHPFKALGHGEILAHPEYMAKEIIKFMEKNENAPEIKNDHITLDELRYCKPIKMWLKKDTAVSQKRYGEKPPQGIINI